METITASLFILLFFSLPLDPPSPFFCLTTNRTLFGMFLF